MTGVEILNTTEVAIDYGFNMGAAAGFAIGIPFILIVSMLIANITDGLWLDVKGWFILTAVGILGGIGLGCAMGFALPKPIAYETHYDVCISEEVSMIEFSEKYEIVDTNGKIFTVREK